MGAGSDLTLAAPFPVDPLDPLDPLDLVDPLTSSKHGIFIGLLSLLTLAGTLA